MKENKHSLFVPGPVQMYEDILEIGGSQPPYFRTEDFSKVIIKCSEQMKRFIDAPEGSEAVILTASGTGAMEAAVMNIFNSQDRLLIINGGGFGQRFCDICIAYNIPFTQVMLRCGEELTREHLDSIEGGDYTGLLINGHETTTGILYDLEMVGRFCRENGLILVVDAISTFLADPYSMKDWDIDVSIFSSQKAFSLFPGLSFLVMSPKAINRVMVSSVRSLYFNLKSYLLNARRGQTPFTPAVNIILQMNTMLDRIETIGVEGYIGGTAGIADDFRRKVAALPLSILRARLSNALTPLTSLKGNSAYDIFTCLKDRYEIYVCPSGGELKDKIFRVAHMGNLSTEDNGRLIDALRDMERRGLL